MKMFKIGCYSFLILFFLSTNCFSGRTNRDLVFEEEEPLISKEITQKELNTPNASIVSVKTVIELTRDDKISTVLPTYEFKSGDKVKILYTVNMNSYVYWLSQGSSGNYMMLFPGPKTGTDNFVEKNAICTIPTKGSFRFDQTPGVEKILLILSENKIPELEQAVQEAAVADGTVSKSTAQINQLSNKQEKKRTTRDLVFEEEEDVESGVLTQSQASANPTEPLVVYYGLKHN